MKAKFQEKLKPLSFATGKTSTIANKTVYHPDGTGYNIMGLLEGANPKLKDEVIILGDPPIMWDDATKSCVVPMITPLGLRLYWE